MDLTGARWGQAGAEAILKLQALRQRGHPSSVLMDATAEPVASGHPGALLLADEVSVAFPGLCLAERCGVMSVRRYLVVANQTLGGPQLVEKLKECMAAGPCNFYFVVPATPVSDLEPVDRPLTLSGVDGGAGMLPDLDEVARAMARRRLEKELARLREAGVEADGEVGDPRPVHAVKDALHKRQVDEIIVSTLPHRTSRWLVMDLPHRVKRSFGLPMTHVAGPAGPAA